jgi:predicted permease
MRPNRPDGDFDDEIESHIQLEADRLVDEHGLDAAEALAAARRRFGNVTSHRERFHEAARWMWLDRLGRDVRHGARRLWRERRFTVTAAATMTLCLGAALATFAVADAILWRPLPMPQADRLVTIYNTYPGAGVMDDGASVANYFERRGTLPPLDSVSLVHYATAIVGDTGATEVEDIAIVTPDFFDTVRVRPAVGRAFTEADAEPTAERTVILSNAAWRHHFAGDPDVNNRFVRANGLLVRVIGVMPPSFTYLSRSTSLYVPFASPPEARLPRARHQGSNGEMIARLAAGASVAAAQAAIDAQNAVLERQDPEAALMSRVGFRSVVVPLRDRHVADVRAVLVLLLWGAAGLVVVGASNIVNLVLIRTAARARDTAVRRAIGAGRGVLAMAVSVETALLAVAGGVFGTAAAGLAVTGLSRAGVDRLPLGASVVMDGRVMIAALCGTVLFAFVMMVPALWLTLSARTAGVAGLQSRGAMPTKAASRARQGLVVAQIAAAFVLLSGSGLLGLSLFRVMQVSPGFRADQTVTGRVTLPWQTYRHQTDRRAFIDRVVSELGRLPGVSAVSMASNIPLSGNDIKSAVTVEGASADAGKELHGYYSYWIAGDFFGAMGVPVLQGRALNAADRRRPERVAVVDADFAHREFPDGRAIGRRLFQGPSVGKDADAFTVVGVVGAVKQAGLTDASRQGAVYFSDQSYSDNTFFFVVRTSSTTDAIAGAMRHVVRSVDPELPLIDVRPMAARLDDSLLTRRSPAMITALFALLALLLAAIGTYGVVSYAVLQRRREIGLRLALGAAPGQIRRQFLAIGWRLLTAGMVAGLAGAWASGRLIQAALYDVPALHVPTIGTAAALLGCITTLACLLPSSRAARISPMVALTDD